MVWSALARLIHFTVVMVRYGAGRLAGGVARRLPLVGRRLPPPRPGPRRLRELLEALGGTFVKFGQVLALQPDLLAAEYCDELFDLMDRMAPVDLDRVERVFREEIGRSPQEVFDRFEETPIASASIAQVHAAWLDGRKLAVKVQRPRARREFGGDILLMKWVIGLIQRLRLGRLDWLARALGEFVAWTGEELDFRAEARFMDELAANSRDRDSERVPEVEWSLTTGRVLTAEFLEGTTLLRYMRSLDEGDSSLGERLAADGFDPEHFAENAVRNFFRDVFHHGVFHADLHPANLLILPNNTVGYVDFGISGVVSEYARYHLASAILALTRGDVGAAADGILATCEIAPDSDEEGCRRAWDEYGEHWFRRPAGGGRLESRVSYTQILLDSLAIHRRHKLLPHPESIRYMRSVVTLDGLISRFAPAVDRDATLERESSKLLEATALTSSLSFDRWVYWLSAGTRWVADGPARVDRALDRLERRTARSGTRARGPNGSERRGGDGRLPLGITAAVLAALAVFDGAAPALGLNLSTALLAVLGCTLALLTREVVRGWR